MAKFWVSWRHYDRGPSFELSFPWWISGYGEDSNGAFSNICCAVEAESRPAAVVAVNLAYDDIVANMNWRFVDEKPDDWTPGSRFPMEVTETHANGRNRTAEGDNPTQNG